MSQLSCYPSHPDWPSDSAYVTAIGSTFITPLAERICYTPGGADCLNNPLGEVTVSVDMGMTWTSNNSLKFFFFYYSNVFSLFFSWWWFF